MPWRDGQFWLVTLAAAAGLWMLARVLIPKRKPRPKRTVLTVSAPSKQPRP